MPVSFCPSVSFSPSVSFCPSIILPPPPWKLLNDLRYLPMSCIILPPRFILPPYHFAPYHFAPWKSCNVHYFPIPVSFCPHIILPPPPGNCFMIYPCPVSFCPLDSFCPPENGLMIYTIYPCPVSFCPLH